MLFNIYTLNNHSDQSGFIMAKEQDPTLDQNLFKCVVGQVSSEYFFLLADSRPVCIAARQHMNGDPIPTKIANRAAAALDLEILGIAPSDARLEETNPNTLTITAQTRFGIRQYHFIPPLNESFSTS